MHSTHRHRHMTSVPSAMYSDHPNSDPPSPTSTGLHDVEVNYFTCGLHVIFFT